MSGERPFRRATHLETLTAILRDDAPELTSPSGPVPPGLERITRRCLEKAPEDRFQSAHDLAFALEAVSGVSAPVRPKIPTHRRWIWVGGLVAMAAMAGLWIGWPREPPPPPLRVRPITSDPGEELFPALSPDGHQVAFVRRLEGRLALYIKLIDGGDPLLVSEGVMDTFAPAWSPDGLQIAFVRHVKGKDGEEFDGVFVVPALGGVARRLATFSGSHTLSWSPEGKTLAFAAREAPEEPTGIFLLSLESGERRRLTRPPAWSRGDQAPRFSRDGRTLAFVRMGGGFDADIYLVPASGGQEQRLTERDQNINGLDWAADGRSFVFSSWRSDGSAEYGLWRVPVSGGDSELLEFGALGSWPTVSRTGGRLAYVKNDPVWDIWRVGGPATPEDDRSPTRLISSTRMDFSPRYSPDGQQIAFASSRSGAFEIWICDSDGSNARQLTFLNVALTIFPSWSPDGERIAFTSAKEGTRDVYVVSASGGLPMRLTTWPDSEIAWSWSRDGRFVYFHSNRSGRFEVWKVSPEGGEAVQVTAEGGMGGFESHDGRFVYFVRRLFADPGIWRIPAEGGAEVQVLDRGGSVHWALLETSIVYVNSSAEPPALELFDLTTREVSQLAELEGSGGPTFAVSPDGRWVLYRWVERESDIMLVENFE